MTKLLTVTIKSNKTQTAAQPLFKASNRILSVKTMGFVNLLTSKVFKTAKGAKISMMATKTANEIKAKFRKAKAYSEAFRASISIGMKELAIKSKKALLKYGYTFEKTVAVAKAYLSLRTFKNSLPYSVRVLITNL